jgi:hypothetical protein
LLQHRVAGADTWAPLFVHVTDACRLLALRISAVGYPMCSCEKPRVRWSNRPFIVTTRARSLLDGVRRYHQRRVRTRINARSRSQQMEDCHDLMHACRSVAEVVVANWKSSGLA